MLVAFLCLQEKIIKSQLRHQKDSGKNTMMRSFFPFKCVCEAFDEQIESFSLWKGERTLKNSLFFRIYKIKCKRKNFNSKIYLLIRHIFQGW